MRIVGLLLSPLLASTLLASTASGSRQHAHVAVNPAAVLATPWAYVGNAAPDYWAELDNDYALCGVEGDEQSPINLDVPPKDLEFKVPDPEDNHVAMEFNYSDAPVEMLYDGHTVRWNVRKETQSTVVADGRTYELRYVEVHTPGEHRVRDIRFPLELQFVHYEIEDADAPKSSKDAAVLEVEKEEEAAVARGQMMIVSVLATEGKENGPVMKMQAALPERANVLQAGKQNMTINADDLLPQRKSYYYYEGSITRPPCVEDVRWYVMTDFIQVSRSQIAAFEDLTGETARPVQGQGYTAAQRKGIEEEASNFDKDAKMPVGAARRRTVDVYTGPDFGVEFHEGQPIPDGRYKPGPTGRRGEQGDRGERGPKGPEGPRGRRGVKGKDGIPGEVGVKGVPGELGDGGDYGLPGLTGNQGAPGPKGPKGPKGPAGKDGKDGEVVRGPKGPVGPSGENLKGDKGDKGPRGPKGPKGPRGPIGQTGPQGIMGDVDPNGPRGPTGPIGDRGQIGRQGPAGPQGVRGKDGAPGPRGERGPQGDRGPMGPAGKELPFTNTNIFAQELAEAVCMSSMTGNVKTGYVYAVMRDCGEKTTCDTICRKYASDPLVPHLSCHNALHVYSNLPAAGIKKRGLKVHKYQAAGCQATYCGPNFCCCSSLEKR